MKKFLLAVAALLMVASISTSCKRGELKGFKKTKAGLYYKFHTKTDSPRAEIGDIVVAEVWVYVAGELEFTNEGAPEALFQVQPSQYPGDWGDALLLIGAGDSVTFAFDFEQYRKHNPTAPEEEHRFTHYTIKVEGIYSMEDFQIKMEEDQIKGEAEEAMRLEAYMKDNRITAKPNADGIYTIATTAGRGATVATGKTVVLNYTGSFLDGKVFDTSLEDVAKEHDVFNAMRTYEPLSFLIGSGQMIPGIELGVTGLRVGTKARLIIPSNMAYGGRPDPTIPAFSTLVFDVEILEVK